MKIFINITRSIIFVLTNIFVYLLVNIGIGFVVMLCQRIHFIIGLILFVIVWKFLLPLVAIIFKNISRISPYSVLVMVTAYLIQGGTSLVEIIGLWIYIIRNGISFSSIVTGIIVSGMSIALCKHSIGGALINVSERT